MAEGIRFAIRLSVEEMAMLRLNSVDAGFDGNVSAYLRSRLGLPPAREGRPAKTQRKPTAKAVNRRKPQRPVLSPLVNPVDAG